jgi:hypothetical protein
MEITMTTKPLDVADALRRAVRSNRFVVVHARASLLALGMAASVGALSLAHAASAPSASGGAAAPFSFDGRCSPLPAVIGSVKELGPRGQARATMYLGGAGEALLQRINLESGAHIAGAGVFAIEIADYGDVIVGIITPDRLNVCDPSLMPVDAWEAIRTAAASQVAVLSAP